MVFFYFLMILSVVIEMATMDPEYLSFPVAGVIIGAFFGFFGWVAYHRRKQLIGILENGILTQATVSHMQLPKSLRNKDGFIFLRLNYFDREGSYYETNAMFTGKAVKAILKEWHAPGEQLPYKTRDAMQQDGHIKKMEGDSMDILYMKEKPDHFIAYFKDAGVYRHLSHKSSPRDPDAVNPK